MTLIELDQNSFVYPGHPVVLAVMIMKKFASWKEASARTKYTFPAALGSQEIPGAGGAVYSALDVLKRIKLGISCEDALAEANRVWKIERDNGYAHNYAEGQKKAEALIPLFKELIKSWDFSD